MGKFKKLDCIDTVVDIENRVMACEKTNKKCNFIECQKLCLYYESESKFMEDLEGEE